MGHLKCLSVRIVLQSQAEPFSRASSGRVLSGDGVGVVAAFGHVNASQSCRRVH
jgi:hypothetical protein